MQKVLLFLLLSCSLFAEDSKKERLVLIHGFLDHTSMYPMKGIFKKNGWEVEHFLYQSREKGVKENGANLAHRLKEIDNGSKMHFIAFSMGGLILKAALNHEACPKSAKEGKIILLSSPIHGSKLARFLGKHPLFQIIMGNGGGKDLYTTKEHGFDTLGPFPSSANILVISGAFSFNPLFSSINDGSVTAKESCLQVPHFHEYIYVGHNWICHDIDTINLIDQFLTGKYKGCTCKGTS
ncbi:hypothetical protein K0U07_04100 [bacterium]|nr:hypothetical protein [bacterium]